jgi:phospholipid transport system substrate-binding protein
MKKPVASFMGLGLKANRLLAAWIALSAALVLNAPSAVAGVPTDQVRGTVDRVFEILANPSLKSADRRGERREQLSKVISARFDFTEMARRSLGSEWRRLNPAQQQEFVRLFTDLLRDAYTTNIESYKGEKVIYKGETEDDPYTVVQTILKSADGNDYTIDYRLHRVGSEWKVYDVVIENVSLVNNYRSQFSRLINKSSYDGLIQALKEKALSQQN